MIDRLGAIFAGLSLAFALIATLFPQQLLELWRAM